MPWSDGQIQDERDSARRLQIFLEVLFTLVLGREVVVPQSYAFDSWGFLDVAAKILNARTNKAVVDHPFRLHLFGASSFDEAVQKMLARVRDPDRPFFSSLMPELNGRTLSEGDLPRDFDQLLASEWLGDDRADMLRVVRAELSSLPRVPAKPRPDAPGLRQLLAEFAGRSFTPGDTAQSAGDRYREVYADLAEAIRRLDPSLPGPFEQRSQLRLPQPWPNDPQHRLPEVVVGGKDKLNLVIEFVDTVYNAVVAGSIGVAPMTFTTDISQGDKSLTARAIAQDLALSAYKTKHLSASHPGGVSDGSAAAPLFEIRTNTRTPMSNQDVQQDLEQLARYAYSDGLRALLEQRAETGEGGGTRSPFWSGIDKLHSALAGVDQSAAQRALEAHLNEVSKILGTSVKIGLESNSWVQIGLTAVGAGGAAVAADATWHLSSPEVAAAAALGAIVAPVASKTAAGARQWRNRRRLFHALGKVVTISELI
jgi:hypothetical protein